MKTNAREILIYYNPESSNDKKTIAHAQCLTSHVRTFSFDQAPSTTTSWKQILKSLDLHPKDILNKAHPYYQQYVQGRDFDSQGWLDVLCKTPSMIKAPIAIRGNNAILCLTSTDIYRLQKNEKS